MLSFDAEGTLEDMKNMAEGAASFLEEGVD